MAVDETQLAEENRKIGKLRRMIDVVCFALATETLTIDEALDLMNFSREKTIELFPEKENAFDIIYKPRLTSIIAERFNSPIERQKRGDRGIG